jgi:hypothetical protein
LLEAVGVIDGVAESRRVDDGQSKFDSAFFDLNRRRVQLNRSLLLQLFGGARNDAICSKIKHKNMIRIWEMAPLFKSYDKEKILFYN